MRQHVAHGDLRLATRCELGPVLGNGAVVVNLAAVGEHVQAGRSHTFATDETLNSVSHNDSWSLSVSDVGPSLSNGSPMFKPQVRRNCAASAAISTAIGWLCRLDSPSTGARGPLRGTSTGSN